MLFTVPPPFHLARRREKNMSIAQTLRGSVCTVRNINGIRTQPEMFKVMCSQKKAQRDSFLWFKWGGRNATPACLLLKKRRGTDSFKHPSLRNPIPFRENRKTTTGRNVTIDFPSPAHSVCNEELKRGSGYKKLSWAEINLVAQTAFNIHELCWILAGKGGGFLIAFPPH